MVVGFVGCQFLVLLLNWFVVAFCSSCLMVVFFLLLSGCWPGWLEFGLVGRQPLPWLIVGFMR